MVKFGQIWTSWGCFGAELGVGDGGSKEPDVTYTDEPATRGKKSVDVDVMYNERCDQQAKNGEAIIGIVTGC